MFKENWKTAAFWRWWWRSQVPADVKYMAAVMLAGVLIVGGYFASGHLAGASAAQSADSYVRETTISKVVTVNKNGRRIVKRVPVVVRKTIVHSSTAWATQVDTRTVTTPGGLRYVTKKVVRYVPVVKKRTVLVNGKTTTVTATQLVPTVKTETSVQTVTNQSTVVVSKPVTTVETHTVTLPPQTVTNTVTQTQTQTQTVTETVVTTVQLPGDTTTITITLPIGG
ncbi:MAG: hypothetical protein ACTHKS_02015 [Gaiellaceae bacterium]